METWKEKISCTFSLVEITRVHHLCADERPFSIPSEDWLACKLLIASAHLHNVGVLYVSVEPPLDNIDAVLNVVKTNCLRLKTPKAKLVRFRVQFVAHVVHEPGVGVSISGLDATWSLPSTKTITELCIIIEPLESTVSLLGFWHNLCHFTCYNVGKHQMT